MLNIRLALAGLALAACAASPVLSEGWPRQTLDFAARPEAAPPPHRLRFCQHPRHFGGHCAPFVGYRAGYFGAPPAHAAPRPVTLAEARAMLDAGRTVAAQAALTTLAAATPQDPAVWALLGRADRSQGRLAAASASIDRALRIDPGHPGALAELGKYHLSSGAPDRARATLVTLTQACGTCPETAALRSALTGAGYHPGGGEAKRVRVSP